MENKILNDSELEMVNGGWSEGAPASITTCPCCGIMDTGAGIGTGRNPMRGLIYCHNPKCKLQFEVYMEGELANTLTGKYYVDGRGEVNLDEYRAELIAKGLI